MKNLLTTKLAVLALTISCATNALADTHQVDSYVGQLAYQDQTLTKTSADALQKRMDLQRASQLVVWSMPMVQFTKAIEVNYTNLDKSRTETPIGLFRGYDGVYPFFTPNGVVPYTIGSLDLNQTGPVILNIPEGPVYGVANNLWQEPIKEFNTFKQGSYLFVGPGQTVPSDWTGEVVNTETTEILWFFRVLAEGDAAEKIAGKVSVYPYAKKDNPPKTEITRYEASKAKNKTTNTPPSDMGYWNIVNRYVQTQPMLDRDRFFYAWLADLGIEKGKEFKPNEYQKEVLNEGLKVGLAMAQANSFNKDFEGVEYQKSNWHNVLAGMDPKIDLDNKSLFDERAAYTYEATTTSNGMVSTTPGKGSYYLGAYYDADQEVLGGSNTYNLHIEPNVPAKHFWSVSMYEAETRLFIRNDIKKADINSRMKDIEFNKDGSVDMYFAPTKPKGVAKGNWIQTNHDESFFLYFRSFGPGKEIIDQQWPMNPVKRIK